MIAYKLELGYRSTYMFANANEAAKVIDLLDKATCAEGEYLKSKTHYHKVEPNVTITRVDIEQIYESSEALKEAVGATE